MRNVAGSSERTRARAEQNPSTRQDDQEAVARRAYELFEARGGDHGRDQEDWFAAERELNADQREGGEEGE